MNQVIKVDDKIFQDLKNLDYDSKEVQGHLAEFCKAAFAEKVKPSLFVGEKIGNIYTGSLYTALASVIYQQADTLKAGHKIILFSYGSGIASSMFQINVAGEVAYMK